MVGAMAHAALPACMLLSQFWILTCGGVYDYRRAPPRDCSCGYSCGCSCGVFVWVNAMLPHVFGCIWWFRLGG
jgi:hypothetical protein